MVSSGFTSIYLPVSHTHARTRARTHAHARARTQTQTHTRTQCWYQLVGLQRAYLGCAVDRIRGQYATQPVQVVLRPVAVLPHDY